MKKTTKFLLSMVICALLSSWACRLSSDILPSSGDGETNQTLEIEVSEKQPFPSPEIGAGAIPTGVLNPESIVYLGLFRLPEDPSWDYSGHGMTFYPEGDSGGDADGFSGSLFIVGHDQQLMVAEVSIPQPVTSKNIEELNTAETLQSFHDISGGNITNDLAIPRMGIEYLPSIDGLDEGKLYFTIGQHIQDFEPSHGWASLDLSNPETEGLWFFDGFTNYATNDYLLEIPEDWADTYAPGYNLACGRFREGVWSGMGSALFAFSPLADGNLPDKGSTLSAIIPLLLFGEQFEGIPEIVTDDSMRMDGYAESDHWWGGAWLTSEAGDAVIFTGTKALGESWYGFANGVVWNYACADDHNIECPDVPDFPYDNRGFWADEYMPAILFFNPDDLAAVAQGSAEPYEPQPYALMDLTEYWLDPETNIEIYKRDLVGSAAFDRTNGILYSIERLADDYKSVVHVFQIAP